MRVIVQKFGGTSVATSEGREKCRRRVMESIEQGYRPVVVVSAMGRKGQPYATDTLIDLAGDCGRARVGPAHVLWRDHLRSGLLPDCSGRKGTLALL